MRGRLVREFSTGDEPLAVNWKMVRIGRGPSARTYRLSDYHDGVSLQNGAVAGQERSSGEPVDHPDHDHEDG
jgi:hypothetical protein